MLSRACGGAEGCGGALPAPTAHAAEGGPQGRERRRDRGQLLQGGLLQRPRDLRLAGRLRGAGTAAPAAAAAAATAAGTYSTGAAPPGAMAASPRCCASAVALLQAAASLLSYAGSSAAAAAMSRPIGRHPCMHTHGRSDGQYALCSI
jgi:hypothetical protein